MKLKFWGAAGEVTGSCHFVEVGGKRLMLDCGLVQGRRRESYDANKKLPFDPRDVDAVVLSHGHLDHIGNLPTWVRNGYRGPVYSTPATRDLAALMLLDSAHIQSSDIERVNRERRRRNEPPFKPLYEAADVETAIELFVSHPLGKSFEPIPGVKAHYLEAGHMLGSAMVVLDIEEAGKTRRLCFSGDIGHKESPLLNDPDVPNNVDFLIMESTYGGRNHPPRAEAAERVQRLVAETIFGGGKLLIPAFAVGRTQEVVFQLNAWFEDGKLPSTHVYVDSPLAVNVTEVFRMHHNVLNDAVRERAAIDPDGDPFGFNCLTYVRDVQDSKRLNTSREPAVIIAASGMCEAGRILHHFKNHLPKRDTTVLFVGFQAEHTLGRKLLNGYNPVPILGEQVPVAARLETAEGFSGHADHDELVAWTTKVRDRGNLQNVFLVHGEDDARRALADGLEKGPKLRVQQPKRGDHFTV